jgi:hypothetical protein
MPTPVKSIKDMKVGDFFEDCGFHPCLCTLAGSEGDKDGVEGIRGTRKMLRVLLGNDDERYGG